MDSSAQLLYLFQGRLSECFKKDRVSQMHSYCSLCCRYMYIIKLLWHYMCFEHTIHSIIGWLLPLPAVLVGIFDKHSVYALSYFNPPMCFTRSQNLWYYSAVLVIQLLCAVEVCLLGVIFRVLHKV